MNYHTCKNLEYSLTTDIHMSLPHVCCHIKLQITLALVMSD